MHVSRQFYGSLLRHATYYGGGAAWHDSVFVEGLGDPDLPGFRGLLTVRILLFFSFQHRGIKALVTWFSAIRDEPCPDIGM
jgi:hypothetical protein